MLELLWLLLMTMVASVRPRQDLVLENLLLRHQLAVLTRPTRTRPRARLRVWDKVLWILARRFYAGWREQLTFVTPDTVGALASTGLAPVLALEVAFPRRTPASSTYRHELALPAAQIESLCPSRGCPARFCVIR